MKGRNILAEVTALDYKEFKSALKGRNMLARGTALGYKEIEVSPVRATYFSTSPA